MDPMNSEQHIIKEQGSKVHASICVTEGADLYDEIMIELLPFVIN